MAISLSLMAGEKKTVEVKGVELTLSPITAADLAYVQEVFVDQPIEELQSTLSAVGKDMAEEDRHGLVRDAVAEQKTRRKVMQHNESDREVVERVTQDMQNWLNSIPGVTLLMWRCVHRNQAITIEEMRELIDVESMQAMQELLDAVSLREYDPDSEMAYADYDPEKKTTDTQG